MIVALHWFQIFLATKPILTAPCPLCHVLFHASTMCYADISQSWTQSTARLCIILLSSWTSRSNLNSIPIGEPVVTLASRLPSLPPECASHCDSCFTFLLWMYPRCHPPPPSSIPIPDYGQLVLPLQFKVSLAYTRTGALHDSPSSGVCSKVTRLTTYHLTKGLWEKKN